MDGVDAEDAGLAVGGRVELPDEAIVVEDRQREVAPPPLRGRLVHLEDVLEAEELRRARAVVDQAVERRQQRGAAGERSRERRGIEAPLARDAVDDGGLARGGAGARPGWPRGGPRPPGGGRPPAPPGAEPQ